MSLEPLAAMAGERGLMLHYSERCLPTGRQYWPLMHRK